MSSLGGWYLSVVACAHPALPILLCVEEQYLKQKAVIYWSMVHDVLYS